MIQKTFNGVAYELPNKPEEVRLSTFEKMYLIMQDNSLGSFDRYMRIFSLFGLPEDVSGDIDEMELVDLIREFNKVTIPTNQLVKTIEVNGRTYTAYDEEFKFKAKDIVEIERAAMKGVLNFPSFILAVLFKDDALTKIEHYTSAHLQHKAKLFSDNLNTDVAIPYLARVAEKTLKAIKEV